MSASQTQICNNKSYIQTLKTKIISDLNKQRQIFDEILLKCGISAINRQQIFIARLQCLHLILHILSMLLLTEPLNYVSVQSDTKHSLLLL